MSLEKYLEALDKGSTFTDVIRESTKDHTHTDLETFTKDLQTKHGDTKAKAAGVGFTTFHKKGKQVAIWDQLEKKGNIHEEVEQVDEESSDMAGAYWSAKLKMEKEKLRKRGMVDQANNLSMKDIMDKNSFKVTAKKDKFDFKTGKHFKEEVEQVDEAIKVGDFVKCPYGKTHRVFRKDGNTLHIGKYHGNNEYGGTDMLHVDKATKVKRPADVNEETELDEAVSKASLEKRIAAAEDAVRRATGARKNSGKRIQSSREMSARSKLQDLRSQLYNLELKEDVEQIDEITSPFYSAGHQLSKHADKLGKDHIDYESFKHHADMLKSGDHSDWKTSAESLRHLDTGARDTILQHIDKHVNKRKEMAAAYYKASGHTKIKNNFISTYHNTKLKKEKETLRKRGMVDQAEKLTLDDIKKKYPVAVREETLEEGSWTDARSDYDGPGKGQTLLKMSEKDHADAINYHKTQMHQLNTGTHKYSKMYDKQERQDKYHYHAHKAALHKDALDHHQMYNEEKDASALDAMDAKEKRKEKIRNYIMNQSPVKIKRVPGKPEVKEETELVESSNFHAKPTASGAKHYALVDYDNDKKSGYGTRKDGHKYVGMAGYQKGDDTPLKNSNNLRKSGLIVKHKDNGKYAVGNVSDKTEWHDKVEDAVAHAHKRFRMDHQHVTPEHVKVLSSKDYSKHVNHPVNEEVELDEAVKFEHDRVIRAHGKKNTHKDYALWMFTHKRTGDVDYDNEKECHQVSATRKDAQKSATEWANKHGHKTVYFME